MKELEVQGGEDGLVFRRKYTKEFISARVVGPREIVGLPGEWVDAVFKLNGNMELFEMALEHLQSKKTVDRVIVKLSEPKQKIRNRLEDMGFVHLGMNIYVKPINPRLSELL